MVDRNIIRNLGLSDEELEKQVNELFDSEHTSSSYTIKCVKKSPLKRINESSSYALACLPIAVSSCLYDDGS